MKALLVATLFAGSAGCMSEKLCSDDPSIANGFQLAVQEAPGLEDAVYHWSVTADGVTRERDVTVVNGAGACACTTDATDPPGAATAPEMSIRMDLEHAELSLINQQGTTRDPGPAHVAVTITRRGAQIATFTFDPTYQGVSAACPDVLRSTFIVHVVGP